MQSSSLWRTVTRLKNPLLSPPPRSAQFHSTSILLGNWNDGKDGGRSQKPSKAEIRFSVRQKRADTKKAIKDYLLYGKSSKSFSQDGCFVEEPSSRNAKAKNSSHSFDDGPRAKGSKRSKHKTWKKKQRLYDIDDDDVDPQKIFEARFGGQKCYTWSFTWTENFDFSNTSTGFNVGGESKEEKYRRKFWNESDDDGADEEPTDISYRAHRAALGLPSTGPLKLDDIKSAFRASALKWHPDKHQGSTQTVAAEKFKLCVNAYNTLRSALKPP